MDTRRCMAERVQQQRGCRNVKRTSCISCGDLYAEMVVSGAVPEFRCLRTPLCAVRLYPDRRYFPEYPRYTEMEDDVSHYASDGKTGDPLDDPSCIRKFDGKLPGTALLRSYNAFHKVYLLKLQVHR